ncbi:hypothetical protein CTI12_AA570290 [Artemisia annua]|uniref:Ulp1 protease family, C-terminal catalytic domain-containing protein n=1 Tax=Artemisia annua TaxID=35608 RepID=A0A2U1KS70_ARTAN|nr:hypothetical protein CTI12_AA570290 [Artemisia annua]
MGFLRNKQTYHLQKLKFSNFLHVYHFYLKPSLLNICYKQTPCLTEWALGTTTITDNMQTLAPQLKVDASVIDSFACVLSYEETITNSGSKIKQYFHTGILTIPIMNAKKEDEEKQYEESCANLTSVFKGNPDDKSMDHVELKKLFSRYLESHKHKKASDIATKKTTLMKLKWGTKQNVIDCGVFIMMHMEPYGGEALKNWKFEFPKEGKEQELR